MAQNFFTCDREQPLLLPPDLHDWLDEDHLAWFVIEAIEELDLEPFYASYRADGHGASHAPSTTSEFGQQAPEALHLVGNAVLTESIPVGRRIQRND